MAIAEDTKGDQIIASVNARLGFAKPSDVVADTERKGLLRAKSPPPYGDTAERIELHQHPVFDWSAPLSPTPSLKKMGFDCTDLSGLTTLQSRLEQVRLNNHLTKADARAIRAGLRGRTLRLTGGGRVKILSIAPEGLIMRRSGPNGLNLDPEEKISEMNGHRAASMVHGDQDVYGTPLRQMLKGTAPWLFRHRTPDGANRFSPIFLLNIWIPLQQITQPLALVDRRTVNNRKHQLRYALPTESFLDRDEETSANDIWLFLHDAAQRWYFHSDLNANSAYVFDTLGEAHGAMTLPGEAAAERYYLALKQACRALGNRDEDALQVAVNVPPQSLPVDITLALRKAVENMRLLIDEAHKSDIDRLLQSHWCARAETAVDRVVRKSIEMRAVAWVV